MADRSSIYEFLREARVPFQVLPHRAAYTAQEEAAAAHIPGRDWAKVVVFFVDDDPVEAVLPAPLVVNADRLLELARGSSIRLAEESELRRLYPGCAPGAMPPLGPLYGHRVFVDVTLAAEPEVVFNAGTHDEAIVMRWADFAFTVRPTVGRIAEMPADRVGEYRLSFRE